jgi:hypothetical protein
MHMQTRLQPSRPPQKEGVEPWTLDVLVVGDGDVPPAVTTPAAAVCQHVEGLESC